MRTACDTWRRAFGEDGDPEFVVKAARAVVCARPQRAVDEFGTPDSPGEVLCIDNLLPFEISAEKLAKGIRVPLRRVRAIIGEREPVTADVAVRLARYFGGDARSWLALPAAYDLKTLPTIEHIASRITPHGA